MRHINIKNTLKSKLLNNFLCSFEIQWRNRKVQVKRKSKPVNWRHDDYHSSIQLTLDFRHMVKMPKSSRLQGTVDRQCDLVHLAQFKVYIRSFKFSTIFKFSKWILLKEIELLNSLECRPWTLSNNRLFIFR